MILNPTKAAKKLAASLLSLSPIIIALNLTCNNSDQVYNECCEGCGYSFSTRNELQQAVIEFRSDDITAENKYGIMNCWSVNKITDMSEIFYNEDANNGGSEDSINEPIECWTVSRVTNMGSMFYGATSFNQPLNSWDTSKTSNMNAMFYNAASFNQPLEGWNVSNVKDMDKMFSDATSFNQPLNGWDTSKTAKMNYLFQKAASFNQPLEGWDVSNVRDMRFMFYGAVSFNQSLTGWDTSKTSNMNAMFYNAASFNQPLEGWNVSNVKHMGYMFYGATSFNQPLDNWDAGSVTDMSYMFNDVISFNQPLNNWDVSNVEDMSFMFQNASNFNQPLDNWNVSSVTDMTKMFEDAESFHQSLCKWYMSYKILPDVKEMFLNSSCANKSDPNFDSQIYFCGTTEYPTCKGIVEKNRIPGSSNYLGLILGLLGVAVLFLCWCKKKNSQHRKDIFLVGNTLQNLREVGEIQRDIQTDSNKIHNIQDEKKAKLYGLTLDIEVDDTADNVSTLQDIELTSEEIFDDRTVGFSTIEFCTVYENNLYGNDMHNIGKSSSTIERQSDQRDVESAYIPEPPVEGCTPIIAESQLCGRSTYNSGIDISIRADDFAIKDERVESSPPQLSDFTGRLQEGRPANSLPERRRSCTSDKSQVIVHAPPGELGLTIIGDSSSSQVQVNCVKLFSPLRSFIQEGDVLDSVDGESVAGLTSTQASSLIRSGSNSTTRVLGFVRNNDESSNPAVEQSIEGVKVIVYAPPGELGLSVTGDTQNGHLTVRSVKSFSPLYGKILEGDVIKSVDGEPTEALTAAQVLSLISSRASNPLRALALDRIT